jgi:peptidyl-prolyl cis-trans isomerase SurA
MKRISASFLFMIFVFPALAQQVVDKVISIVGKHPILLSELQGAMLDQERQEMKVERCRALELLVFQKLLIVQADRDSVTVSDAEVENELNKRMAHFIQMFKTEEELERYYGKRTNVLKDEFRPEVHDQLLAQKMQSKITGDDKPTPAEVRQFYKTIPADSLPLINSEVEIQQIVKKPSFSPEAKAEAREKLESLRQRVLKGESMSTLARLYSEDPSVTQNSGMFKSVARGVMDPAFEAVAFRLKNNEVSQVFESSFGYHFIELIQRKGELLDLRHILIMPKMSNADYFKSRNELDSIYSWIKRGLYTFEEAAAKFSDDKDTKQNGGLMINHSTASTKFDDEDLSAIDPNLIVTLNSMQVGEISRPMKLENEPAFRIIKLKNRIDPHKMNVKDDYQKVATMTISYKNKKMVRDWIRRRSKITYIKIDPEFRCAFENDWYINN